ncbi:MAG TPA: hypothetical protein VGI85_06320 [Chthoniobacterales bacterium]
MNNITELQGEKTVASLAKRLLADPSKDTPKTTQSEMEAALLRLNPELDQIKDLPKGTAIVVPGEFALAPDESTTPAHTLASDLLAQAEKAVANLQAMIKAGTNEFAAQSAQVQTWLKGDQAKQLAKESPQLKETFSSAAAAAKAAPKELTATVTATTKALDQVAEQVSVFRITNLRANATTTASSASVTSARLAPK